MVAAFPAFSQLADSQAQAASAGTHALTKIDLVFSGGSPLELIAAIQKSLGRPINVVIPDRASSLRIPALMMKQVDLAQLFRALSESSVSNEIDLRGPVGSKPVQG
jgi:hypothetical protein